MTTEHYEIDSEKEAIFGDMRIKSFISDVNPQIKCMNLNLYFVREHYNVGKQQTYLVVRLMPATDLMYRYFMCD